MHQRPKPNITQIYDQKKNRYSLKDTGEGKECLTGVISALRGNIQILVLKNGKKTENQPDYDILLSESKEERR